MSHHGTEIEKPVSVDPVSVDPVSGDPVSVDPVSGDLLMIFNTVNLAILAATVAFLGIIANIINITIFSKQGFHDTVNIGLTALSISDLFSLIMQEWINILNNPLVFMNLPIIAPDVQHLTGCWPHVCFPRVSSWITVYITMERCLCVVLPLKIKSIITPTVTVWVIACIFVIMFLTPIPEYASSYLAWRQIPVTNRTVLGIVFLPGRELMTAITYNTTALTQFGSFTSVIFFTVILVFKMKQKSKWRMSASNFGSDSSKETLNRDKRTVKMIILVAVIYCFCFLPMLFLLIVPCIEPEFITFGLYNNSYFVAWSFAFLFDSINASVNIIVYYTMSSKYRKTFDSLFRKARVVTAK